MIYLASSVIEKGLLHYVQQPHVYVYEEDIMMNKHAYLDYAAITVADIDWSLTRAA